MWRGHVQYLFFSWLFKSGAADTGLIPLLARSPGRGHGNSLQYSCLENPWTEKPGGLQSMGSQNSWIQLSDYTTTVVDLQYYAHLYWTAK